MENTKTTDNSKLNYFSFLFFYVPYSLHSRPVWSTRAQRVLSLSLYFSGIRRSSWIVALSSRFYGAFAFISQNVKPLQHPDETPRSV